MQMTSIQCPTCGAPSHITKPKGSITCEYCGVAFVLEIEDGNVEIFEEGVHGRPFTSSSLDFRMKLLDWLCAGELTPDDILESVSTVEFHGTYVPFWFYTSDYVAEANCKVGTEHEEVTYEVIKDQQGKVIDRKKKTHTTIEWSNTKRSENGHYEVTVLATTKVNPSYRSFIKDHTQDQNNFQELTEDNLDDHTLGQATDTAEVIFEQYGKEDVDRLITSRIYAEDTNEHFKVTYLTFTSTNQVSKQVYLPFWMATFEYEDKSYPIIFNGENLEESWGNHPKDEQREAKFEEIYKKYNSYSTIYLIFGILGLFAYIVPGLIIGGVGIWHCNKLKKEADTKKQAVLDRSYAIRHKAKEALKQRLKDHAVSTGTD